ncbi:MATE family efflux transporter [Aerococcus viridans]
MLNAFTGMVMNQAFIQYGGDLALSGYGIVNSVQYLLILPLYGIVQGIQPIFAFNMGAKLWSRVKEALKISLVWGVFIGIVVFLATRIWPESLVGVFTDNQELKDMAVYMVKIWMLGVPVVGVQTVGASFYQTMGQPIKATLLSAMPFTDYISSTVTFIFLFISYRQMIERQGEQEEDIIEVLESKKTI